MGVVDYDHNGEVIGVEILHLSKRSHPVDISDFQLQTHRKPKDERPIIHIAA